MLLCADTAGSEKQKNNTEDQRSGKKRNLVKIKDESIESRTGSTKTLSQG